MNCPHCKVEIDKHEATRCLDRWVAEAAMGYYFEEGCLMFDDGRGVHESFTPYYSAEIEQAWKVVENINNTQIKGHVGPTMLHRLRQCAGKRWGIIWCSDFGFTEEVFAPTAQLAICRSAIKAKGKEDE